MPAPCQAPQDTAVAGSPAALRWAASASSTALAAP